MVKAEIDTINIRIGEQFKLKISIDETQNVIIPKLKLKGLEVIDLSQLGYPHRLQTWISGNPSPSPAWVPKPHRTNLFPRFARTPFFVVSALRADCLPRLHLDLHNNDPTNNHCPKNYCLGSTRRFHIYIYIYIYTYRLYIFVY